MTEQRIFMNEDAILNIIDGMARMLKERLAKNGIEDPAMIGKLIFSYHSTCSAVPTLGSNFSK